LRVVCTKTVFGARVTRKVKPREAASATIFLRAATATPQTHHLPQPPTGHPRNKSLTDSVSIQEDSSRNLCRRAGVGAHGYSSLVLIYTISHANSRGYDVQAQRHFDLFSPDNLSSVYIIVAFSEALSNRRASLACRVLASDQTRLVIPKQRFSPIQPRVILNLSSLSFQQVTNI
jgi:hypothetical protein